MEPSELAEALERARVSLRKVYELYSKGPDAIKDGSMEKSLRELSSSLRLIEEALMRSDVVRRPYSGLSTEASLLGGLAMALRLRMNQLGRTDISGLEDFYRRLRDLLERASVSIGRGLQNDSEP